MSGRQKPMMKRGLAQDAFKRQRIRFGLALLAVAAVGTVLSIAGAYNSCRTHKPGPPGLNS